MLGMSVDKHCTRTNSVTRFDTQLRTTDSTGATTRTARSPHICVHFLDLNAHHVPQVWSLVCSENYGITLGVKILQPAWSGLSRLR